MTTRRDRACCCSSDPPAGSGTADCCRLHGQQSTDKCTADRVTVQVSGSAVSDGLGCFACCCRGCLHAISVNKTTFQMVRNYGTTGQPLLCNTGTGSQGYIPQRWYSGTVTDAAECSNNPRSVPATGAVTDRPDSSECACNYPVGDGCPPPPLCQCCVRTSGSTSPCADGGRCYSCEDVKSIQPRLWCTSENGCQGKRFWVSFGTKPGQCLSGQGCTAGSACSCGPASGLTGTNSSTLCCCSSCNCSRNACGAFDLIGVGWTFRSEVMSSSACPPDVTKWSLYSSTGDDAWGTCNVF